MSPLQSLHQGDAALSMSPDYSADEMARLLAEARHSRDQAVAARLTEAASAIWAVLGSIGQTLASWPRRRATYERLRSLSDRDLADIGMQRGDISRVFEPDFVLPSPANANATATHRAA